VRVPDQDAADAVTTFERERAALRGLAYRMLGSFRDVDDVVQDTWLRWSRLDAAEREAVRRPGAWLRTTTARLALDRLRAETRRREEYVGQWLPEPVVAGEWRDDVAERLELAESLTLGFLAVLERLAPIERAVFLLVEVFDTPYREVANVVDRSEAACRQIAHRARERVRDGRARFVTDGSEHRALVEAFAELARTGDGAAVRSLLHADVSVTSDGGPAVHAARRAVVGAHRAGRYLGWVLQRIPPGCEVRVVEVNRQAAVTGWWGDYCGFVAALEVRDGAIAAVRIVVNPDKLVGITERGPLA
jgi:RNA polymerase sigma factor (sigma-70 family)